MPVMDWVTPDIAVWEYPSSKTDLDQFDAILNVDRYSPYHTTVHHAHMPIIDGPGNAPHDIAAVVDRLHSLVQRGKVLLHCAAGVSRSPFIMALYLAFQRSMAFDEALSLVASRRRRPLNIDPGLLELREDVLSLLNGTGESR